MSLLNPPTEAPRKSRAMTFTVVALAMVAVVVLWVMFRYYPEKKAAEHFFDSLVAGDTTKAYALWQPGPSYGMKDFMADWGPQGYYGPVKSYRIMRLNTPHGANVVAVEVSVSPYAPMPEGSDVEKSSKTRVVNVWILPADKSFSFSPNSQ